MRKKLAMEKRDGRDHRIVYKERSSKVVQYNMDCWCVHVFICSYHMRDPGRAPSLRLPSARQIDASDGSLSDVQVQ